MVGSLEPIVPGVVDEFGSVEAIANLVLAVTDTRPAANVAIKNFTLTDSRAASSQLVEQSAQPPRESPLAAGDMNIFRRSDCAVCRRQSRPGVERLA